MQILSYNPQDDEFFIGLSLEEFKKVSRDIDIDYGYKSNYECEKEKAINKYNNEEYTKMIKDFYQVEKVPFVCIVTDRYCSKLSIRPSHFPYGVLWNGYSPWRKIVVCEVETLSLHNVETRYIHFSDVVKSFCDEWIEKFSDEKITPYQLVDGNCFSNYCKSFGWFADNGIRFCTEYSCNSYDEALDYLPQVTDMGLLGGLIFSYWRYFNHWAYSIEEILNYKEWFVETLTRLKEIAGRS